MESGVPTVPPYVAGPLHLEPFRAYSLAPRRVGDPASARIFARPYRAVPQRLDTWWRRGLASRADDPSLYLHEYTDSGLTIRGLVGCLDVSRVAPSARESQVFPHEDVHQKQVSGLASRMSTMRVNPAPILLVHRGPASIREVSRKVRTGSPEREYVDHAGQQHRIWAITESDQVAAIDAALAEARLLVADGHHRYAAYVALHSQEPTDAHRTGLAMVIDQDETPMFLGAIHRLLHGVTLGDAISAASGAGARVRTIDVDEALAALAADTLVLTDGERWATVSVALAPGTAMVQLLEDLVLEGLPKRPSRQGFAHSVGQALEQVKPGRVIAALLPAVDLDLVMDVARGGALLPGKATSFQPKPSLGTFIRPLDG
jgi:hypothetical protein